MDRGIDGRVLDCSRCTNTKPCQVSPSCHALIHEDAEKASGAGSEGKTDLSANPDGQEVAAEPKDEKNKSGGFCACFSKKKKEDEEKPPDGEEVPPPPAEKNPS